MSFRREFQSERELMEDIIRRLDDLERNQHPVVQVDGQTFYVNPRTGEMTCLQHCLDCDPCACCDQPTGQPIWLCTTLREGDTTWTSLGGDTRTLDPIVAEGVADGGLALNATNIWITGVYPAVGGGDLPSGLLEVEMDVTSWWDFADGWESHSYFYLIDWNFNIAFVPVGYWTNAPIPTQYGLTDNNFASYITADPPSMGLSGYRRGRVRYTYNSSTGDAELFLALPGGAWVSQGTLTLAAAPVGEGFELRFGQYGQYDSPAHWNIPVVHSLKITNAGSLVTEFDEAVLAANLVPFVRDTHIEHDLPLANDYVINQVSFNSGWINSPGGAPLFMRERQGVIDPLNTYVPNLWTDGPPLVSPAIAYTEVNSATKVLISNEQPSDFSSDTDAYHVLAVADLDGFADITDGWPTGYWPFGSTIA